MLLIQIFGVCRFGGIVQQMMNIMDTSNNNIVVFFAYNATSEVFPKDPY
jgi:hypothetical protein